MAYVKHIKDSWLLSHYRAARAYADLGEGKIGEMVKSMYDLVDGRWVETERTCEDVTWKNYFYVFDAIPFFLNLGGREIVKCAHTKFGYLPVKVSSFSPDGDQKAIYHFTF